MVDRGGEEPDEETLRAAVLHSPSYVALLDDDGRLLWLNQRAGDRTPAELVGASLDRFMRPDELQSARAAIGEALATGEARTVEVEIQELGGARRWRELRVIPLPHRLPERRLLMISSDARGAVEARAQVRASDERLRAILAGSPDLICVVDRALRIVFVSRDRPEGWPSLLNQSVLDIAHPDDMLASQRQIEALFETGEPQTYLARGRLSDATWQVRATRLSDDEALLFVRDMSEVRAAERELVESEQRLELAARAAKVSFWEWWPSDDRVELSATVRSFTELPSSVPLAQFMERLIPEDRERVSAQLEAVRHGHTDSFESEYRLSAQPGMWLMGRGAVVERGPDGAPQRLLGCTLDITGRKEIEAVATQLHHAQRLESIGQLAGGVAHDFNNLLQVLQAELSMLEMRFGDDAVEELESASAAVERAAELTSHLLTYARRQPHSPRSVGLDEIVNRTSRMLERLLPENVALDTSGAQIAASAHVDVGQVEQVLTNLCVNARDAMPEGGTITISVEQLERDGQSLCAVVVRDEGEGFDATALARGAEPFFTTKAAGKGTGLGLSVVLGIAERHDGFLELGNHPDGGAQVRVAFPASAQPPIQSPARARATPVAQAGRVLLVEDDGAVRRVTARALRRVGLTVVAVDDGNKGLELARAEDFDVAVIDVRLPGLSGIELVQTLDHEKPRLPVVMVSGYGEETLPASWLRDRGIQLLHKPFGLDRLLEAVQTARAVRE